MRRLAFSGEAERDLIAIALHVGQSSRTRAKVLVDRLRARCEILVTHPLAGRPRPELGDAVRTLVERPYLVVYRIEAERLFILAFLHGARDLPSAMRARDDEKR